MKTAISIPDTVFRVAERTAKRLGLSRSEFYRRAIEAYVEGLRRQDLRRRVDDAYAGEDSSIDRSVVRAQAKALRDQEW